MSPSSELRDPAAPGAPQLGRRRPPPRRRTALSRDDVVHAAIAVLDESGVGALSMRAVAQRLGTGPASLYAYVAGKDQLLELVFDELVGQVALPPLQPERWREQVHEIVRGLYDVLVSHRDAALTALGHVPMTPNALRASEAIGAALRAGGVTDRVMALGLDQLSLYTCGAAFEASVFNSVGATHEEVMAYFDAVHDFFTALPADRFPVLASIAGDLTSSGADDRFRFGVDVLLAGMEAMSKRPGAAP